MKKTPFSTITNKLHFIFFSYINFLAEMVSNDKNPSEAQQLALQKEKKVIVHSLRGKNN
jgi:hypothetical protein